MAIKGRRSTPDERLRAVQLLKEGNEAELVARIFGVSRRSYSGGSRNMTLAARRAGDKEDSRTCLPAETTQMSQLYVMVSGCDPRQLEFDFGLWTRRIIRDLIMKRVLLVGAGC